MKKKILIISFIALSVISSLKAVEIQTLTGDTKLACEALLCLSSPTRPSECMPALRKYFSIHFKKAWKTVQARKDFLNLCPAGSSSKEMLSQVNSLSQIDGYCTTQELNSNIEKIQSGSYKSCNKDGNNCTEIKIYSYRISPKMTRNCQILTSMSYNDYNFKYTCDGKFYTKEDWDNGFTKQEISQNEYYSLKETERLTEQKLIPISYNEYRSLPNNKKSLKYGYYRIDTIYYKKIPINKNCWVENKN